MCLSPQAQKHVEQLFTCAICYESEVRGQIDSLACSHMFCAECIDEWIENGGRDCPECRAAIAGRQKATKKMDDLASGLDLLEAMRNDCKAGMSV